MHSERTIELGRTYNIYCIYIYISTSSIIVSSILEYKTVGVVLGTRIFLIEAC